MEYVEYVEYRAKEDSADRFIARRLGRETPLPSHPPWVTWDDRGSF
jgi:hypothetical protein